MSRAATGRRGAGTARAAASSPPRVEGYFQKSELPLASLAFLLPLLAGILLAIFLTEGNVLGVVLYIITGVLAGLLAFLIVLGCAAAYVRWGALPLAAGLLYGVKPVIIAIVAQALVRLARAAIHGEAHPRYHRESNIYRGG